ncbi:sugar phosphate nucleotidyltransferase [Alphaproteobacteria bacterium]|nr:sugar phosphate nucleotidyltransferase [Alphaproteobacteria bacterium]
MPKSRKGIIMAGGSGSRLFPITNGVSKHLLPVYDKPMIYYSISTLISAGINKIAIITKSSDLENFKMLLGDGSRWGLNFKYLTQDKSKGIAEGIIIAEKFLDGSSFVLILGDNIFYGNGFSSLLYKANKNNGASIFGYKVSKPERFGVVKKDQKNNLIKIIEKPNIPPSNIAVTGLYFFDNKAISFAKSSKFSARGELEITDVINQYINLNLCNLFELDEDFSWLDAGTLDSLMEASHFIKAIQKRKGKVIACIEELSLVNKLISKIDLRKNYSHNNNSEYNLYVKNLIIQ